VRRIVRWVWLAVGAVGTLLTYLGLFDPHAYHKLSETDWLSFVGSDIFRTILVIVGLGLILLAVMQASRPALQGATGPSKGESAVKKPLPYPTAAKPAPGSPLLKPKGTNDGHWPRIESAVDSFGHVAERAWDNSALMAITDYVLRPGQHVSFVLEVTDPNGDDLELRVIAPAPRDERNVDIADGVITWRVTDADIADPARVHIYVASSRSYHRISDYDDTASFVYRVLPRL
jgi:hypothetical protein